jgi:tight adherence protein B
VRGLAALAAAAAVWALAGLPLPGAGSPGLALPRPRVIAAGLVAGALGTLSAISLGGNVAMVAAAGSAGLAAPQLVSAARRRRRLEEAAARWPDFLAVLRGRLSAGEALPEATAAAAAGSGEHLAVLGRRLAEDRAPGRPFAATLAAVRAEWADPLADRVLTALAAAAGIGGERVGAVLAGLASSVADELRLRRAHEAALTGQRLTAGVALAAPWALLLLTTATNPQAAAAYSTSTGTMVVLIGLVATLLGFWLSRRAARLSRMPRVFT